MNMQLSGKIRIWSELTSTYLDRTDYIKVFDIPWDEYKEDLHFLIILTDRIGDAFNSIYFIANLRRLYPNAKLTYITKSFGDPQFGKLILGQYVDEVLFGETLKRDDFLDIHPDVVFDLNPIYDLFKYYPKNWSIRIGHHKRCDIVVHQVENNLKANDHTNILRTFGKDIKFRYPKINLISFNNKKGMLQHPPKPYIALCPEATARSWMVNSKTIDAFIEYLLDFYDYNIAIVGSDINGHGYSYYQEDKRVYQYTKELSLCQSICVLDNSEYVVAVDTGIMHAASYLGKPILSIFTCGTPGKNATQGQYGASVLLRTRTDPSPAIPKRDYLQSFKEHDYIRLDHMVDGFNRLTTCQERYLEQYIENERSLTYDEMKQYCYDNYSKVR